VITISLLAGYACLILAFLAGYLFRGLRNSAVNQHAAVDTSRARLQQQQVSSRQQLDLLEKRNLELNGQIEGISAKVFADNSHRMTELTESHLQQVLAPLREQIGDFKQKVEDVYDRECRDRTLLKAEIGQLKNLNERISADAVNLSNALRGDNKTLGNWGELILERVLERAGLKHIEGLGAKGYENLDGVNSLNFVLMFVPVEAALQAALEFDESLYKDAYDRDVVLVGPSSLMVTCRTIQNVWHSELQNKNAAVIARKAGEMIDKFDSFAAELDSAANALDMAVVSVESARRKLTTGRGNLVSRAKKLQELGASSRKCAALTD